MKYVILPAFNSRDHARKLFEDNRGLVPFVIGRYYNHAPISERDEIESVAMVALWRACELYNPAKGRLSTLAVMTMKGRIAQYLKRTQAKDAQLPVVSLDDPLPDGSTTFHDVIAGSWRDNPAYAVVQQEEVQEAAALIQGLTGRRRERLLKKARYLGFIQ